MNNIMNNNNVNFQAKLDVSHIKGSKNRWKEISKTFEKMTSDAPDYTFKGYDSFESGLAFDLVDKKNVILNDCCFSEKGSRKLAELPNSEIAQKIKKLFNLLVKLDNIEQKAAIDYEAKGIEEKSEKLQTAFWANVTQKQQQATQDTIGGDELLTKGMLYY